MPAFARIVQSELRLISREPSNLLFILLFPAGMAWLIAGSNATDSAAVTATILSMLTLSPMLFGLMTFPMILVGYRERGMLRRLRVTPLSPLVYLGAQALVGLFLVGLGGVLVLAVGLLQFKIAAPVQPLGVALVFLLGTLAFTSLGALIGSVLRTTRVTQVVSVLVFGSMMLTLVLGQESSGLLQQVVAWLPITHFTNLIEAAWIGIALPLQSVALLLGFSVVSLIGAARLFRWE